MKIKDYSLINNEWIDERMKELEPFKDTNKDLMAAYVAYNNIKQQLIPSEKLADKCFEEGKDAGIANYIPEWATFDEQVNQDKQHFFNSEIEIE